MAPKICCSILDLRNFTKERLPFEGYELRSSSIKPNIIKIIKLKELLKGEDLSLHTRLGRLFSCKKKGYEKFIEAEMKILESEIIISEIIGINKINIHLTQNELDLEEIKKLKEIISFAKTKGIELIYENHVCSAKTILYILETFPELDFCLDLGHLNLAISKDLFKMDLNDFFEKINKRTIHIHAHNNEGDKDSHSGINKGTFDWKNALSKLTHLKKVILEIKNPEEVFESKKLLEEFYKN